MDPTGRRDVELDRGGQVDSAVNWTAAGRYGVTVTTENMPALKWPGMLQTNR
jgi:hypothetical protein